MSATGLEGYLVDGVKAVVVTAFTALIVAPFRYIKKLHDLHDSTKAQLDAHEKHVAEHYAKRVDLSKASDDMRVDVRRVEKKIDDNHNEIMGILIQFPRK